MITPNFAVYLGKEREGGFSGFIAEGNLFLILEIEDGLTHDQGRDVLKEIKQMAESVEMKSLSAFDEFISENIKKLNLPFSFSLAAGYLKNNIFYLKTIGAGKIFLQKEQNFAKIIENYNTASGYVSVNDFFIFTTQRFIDIYGKEENLNESIGHRTPHELVEEITPHIKGTDDQGSIALFVRFSKKESEETFLDKNEYVPANIEVKNESAVLSAPQVVGDPSPLSTLKGKKNILDAFKEYSRKFSKRKTWTLILVAIIFVILVWSVVLGVKRRSDAQLAEKIKTTQSDVQHKLNAAQDSAFLDLSNSQELISQAKNEVDQLKKQLGNKENSQVDELYNLIKQTEDKIVKKEEKNYEEFFNLTLDSKDASGDKLYLDGDNLDILDSKKSSIYTLSLSKKSLDKKSDSNMKSAKFIASFQDKILFLSGDIFQTDSLGKTKKVINKDSEWGNLVDMELYNGNIYILDNAKSQIYKYLVTDNGFSDKNNYLKPGGYDLTHANSLAIDSSIYIGFSDHILKFTAGAPDDFKTVFPNANVNLNKIFTTKDSDKVYAWDKDKGNIYVLAKDGTYEKQISSSILTKATDIVVYNNTGYLLQAEKIYKINLD